MAEQSEIAELIKNIQADITTIVRGELALAKEELMPSAKAAGTGAGLFGMAGYLAMVGLATLFTALGFAWSAGFQAWFHLDALPSLWWGFAVDAVVVFLVAGIAALIGRSLVTKANFTPEATIASIEDTVEGVKAAVETGNRRASRLSLLGSEPRKELP
jgi:preprotein translocase subunit Sss1